MPTLPFLLNVMDSPPKSLFTENLSAAVVLSNLASNKTVPPLFANSSLDLLVPLLPVPILSRNIASVPVPAFNLKLPP